MTIAALEDGSAGVRASIPDHWQRESDSLAADAELGLVWAVFSVPFAAHIDRSDEDGLIAELEAGCRAAFEAEFAGRERPGDPGPLDRDEPRTADPAWSPVVESEIVDLSLIHI